MSAVETFPETEIEVRDALPDDAHAISAIYACMYFMAVRPSRKKYWKESAESEQHNTQSL